MADKYVEDCDKEFLRNLWMYFTDQTKKDEIGKNQRPELYYFVNIDNFFLSVRRGRGSTFYVVGHNVKSRLKSNAKERNWLDITANNLEIWGKYDSLEEAVKEWSILLHSTVF